MSTRNDITHKTPYLALDFDERVLTLELIDRAAEHFEYMAATTDFDDHTRDTYRRTLMRDALIHGLVAIDVERRRRREEENQYLCVGGSQ